MEPFVSPDSSKISPRELLILASRIFLAIIPTSNARKLSPIRGLLISNTEILFGVLNREREVPTPEKIPHLLAASIRDLIA